MATVFAKQQGAPTNELARQPIRVEISQPAEPHAGWEKWIALVDRIAWPIVAIVGLLLFRKPLVNLFDVVGKRATEISIGGLGIKLPALPEAQLSEDVLTFRAADTFMVISTSAKSLLFSMFEQAQKYEYVAVNLGRGDKWLSSRLYIFAAMLQRMKALRCIVFLNAGAATESEFFGATTPDKVRWGLARKQPWLEVAYEHPVILPVWQGLGH